MTRTSLATLACALLLASCTQDIVLLRPAGGITNDRPILLAPNTSPALIPPNSLGGSGGMLQQGITSSVGNLPGIANPNFKAPELPTVSEQKPLDIAPIITSDETQDVVATTAEEIKKATDPARMVACEVDNDCIAVQSSCCSCSEGGKRTAINVLFLSEYSLTQASACKDTTCTEQPSEDATCGALPQCVESICILK